MEPGPASVRVFDFRELEDRDDVQTLRFVETVFEIKQTKRFDGAFVPMSALRGEKETRLWRYARLPPTRAELEETDLALDANRQQPQVDIGPRKRNRNRKSDSTDGSPSQQQWCTCRSVQPPTWLLSLPPASHTLLSPDTPLPNAVARGHWLVRRMAPIGDEIIQGFWDGLCELVSGERLGMVNAMKEWREDVREGGDPGEGSWQVAIFCEYRYCLQIRTALNTLDCLGTVVQRQPIPYVLRRRVLLES